MLTVLNNIHYSSISRLDETSPQKHPPFIWVEQLSQPLNGDFDTSDENKSVKGGELWIN